MRLHISLPSFNGWCGDQHAMTTTAGEYRAPLDIRRIGQVRFAESLRAVRVGSTIKVSFAVDKPVDVEVAILESSSGKVVRHLAAGLLGKNAPPPFRKDSLGQEIVWDGKDDKGRYLLSAAGPEGGRFKVRVRLGLDVQLDRFIPARVSGCLPAHAVGVGPDGTVYVLSSRDKAGGVTIYALDGQGRYLRTLLPSPAGLRREQVRGLERLRLDDGTEVPVIYSAYIADFAPYLAGIQPQRLEVTQDGWIVFASGGNNWTDQIVPRHALVLKTDGTIPPEIGFVGPPLGPYSRYSIGLRQQQIALSLDGKTLYFCGMGVGGRNPTGIHCIGRTTWEAKEFPQPCIGKPDEPGADGEHLNNPTSVTTDAKGNIYVTDSGNQRVAVFDASYKFIGATSVPNPGLVCVHLKTGALYVGSSEIPLTGKHEPPKPYSIIKFDRAIEGKEVARFTFNNYRYQPVIALDASADPPRLWLCYAPAFNQQALVPITDTGDKLIAGQNVTSSTEPGFTSPLFIAADPARNRLYVGDFARKILKVELDQDKISHFLTASEAAVDSEGNVYALLGYGTDALGRFTPEGQPHPFPGLGTHIIKVPYRAGLPHVGVRGLTVAPNGDVYVFEEKSQPEQLHVFRPDGKEKRRSVIQDIPTDSANSIAVDREGNIYVGINVHDPQKLYPDELASQLPPYAWERTYRKDSSWYNRPQRKPPDSPWDALYLNHYLYVYGNVFKFGPEGGQFWRGDIPRPEGNPRPQGVPPDATEYRTALLGHVVWAVGAQWVYPGFGLCASRTEGSGDPTCSCFTSRFAMDNYGRLWVPDVFRFRVTVLDSLGNELARIGSYGNLDSAGPGSLMPQPAIPFTFPNAVAVTDDRMYVADRKSRRIVVATIVHAAEEVTEVRGPF
ncbi:MAG: hypothetical protein ACUVWX_08490 [Kiritimatiellia bacterium]